MKNCNLAIIRYIMFLWRYFLTILSISALSVAINRPVYKIILNSKGYAQFIQYGIDVPPLREFTLCVWVRVTSLESDQTIFTYVGTDGGRIMRLWLDSGGRQLKISLEHDRVTSSAAVEFTAGAWRDVCVSYQADHGTWALYVDAKLLLCEGFKKFRGYYFSGKGSLIIGYGISEKGFPTGLSGEIYGASMILYSTIERNITLNTDPWISQKYAQKNYFSPGNMNTNQYVVLGDLQSGEVQPSVPRTINKEYEFFSSDLLNPQDNVKSILTKSPHSNLGINKKGHDFSIEDNRPNDKDNKADYNQVYRNNKFKVIRDLKRELTGSGTQDLPMVLEYETPPTITASTSDYSITNRKRVKSENKNHRDDIISDFDKPPPPDYETKVYGQWTNSKFASSVLKYLKNINFMSNKKPKNMMSTSHVEKLSDSYPYPSQFRQTIVRPKINYMRKIHSTQRRHIIVRRDNKEHQINLQIINPVDSDIIFPLKNVDPKLVEVTNRGEPNRDIKRIQQNVDDNSPYGTEKTRSLKNSSQNWKYESIINTSERHRGSSLMNIIPYIKEYYVNNETTQTNSIKNNRLYSNGQPRIDPWDNVNQRIASMADENKHAFGNRSKSDLHNQKQAIDGDTIGRALAKEVSNQAKQNSYNIPLSNYRRHPITQINNNILDTVLKDEDVKEKKNKNNFNKHVKLGNALNEQFITGFDAHQVKNTFLGGNDAVPDINRYRSKSNSKLENIPASLETRVCKNVELYVLEDDSISNSKIKSPLNRNVGIEFIIQSYKKCSTKDSTPKDNSLIAIDWITTPVKLFGGAYAKKTKDLCGFF